MNKAIFTGIIRKTPKADGRVFLVSPPLDGHEFVCVSAANMEEINALSNSLTAALKVPKSYSGMRLDIEPETLIFPCDPSGEIAEFQELGGYRGGLSHAEALKSVGYEIAEESK